MRFPISWVFGLLATLVLALPLSAATKSKDTLVIGISQFPRNFNPNIESMLAKSYVLAMTRRPLTVYGADWTLECMLCVELPNLAKGTAKRETTADGKPGIAITYTLRSDANWGDGTPITTRDVVFTWELGRNRKTGFGNLELFERITSIDVHDAKRFTLHVNKYTCEYAAMGGLELLPAHIEAPHAADPESYRVKSAYETDTTNPGLWYGPYKIAEVATGSHIVLDRNPTWWGKAPAFKRIVIKAIENTAALTASLLSGDIDYIAGELGLTTDQALAFQKRHGKTFTFQYKSGLIYEHIDLNLDSPILKDNRVRRALLHAIDRAAINQQLFQGRQPVAHGQTNPLDTVYDPNGVQYAHDPARARKLLTEAGWKTSGKSVRQNAKGDRLQLDLMTTAGNKSRELIQQVLQSQWREVGVDIRIRNEPARVFFGETVSSRKFPHMAMYAWISAPKGVPRTTLHSTQIPAKDNGWSGQNYPGFANAAMDKVLDEVEVVCEDKPNKALWRDLQRIYAEELPVLPLYFRANPFIMPKWLKGVTPTGHQFTSALWVEHWRVA
ncbi:MAG: peptide ABC transporter substrate-binding protein, partial [Rhodospirillaceae bacterium]|nr:peptide ABC transporter substrate-binding protein [Rhodospirillaceae bacterium]